MKAAEKMPGLDKGSILVAKRSFTMFVAEDGKYEG